MHPRITLAKFLYLAELSLTEPSQELVGGNTRSYTSTVIHYVRPVVTLSPP